MNQYQLAAVVLLYLIVAGGIAGLLAWFLEGRRKVVQAPRQGYIVSVSSGRVYDKESHHR